MTRECLGPGEPGTGSQMDTCIPVMMLPCARSSAGFDWPSKAVESVRPAVDAKRTMAVEDGS